MKKAKLIALLLCVFLVCAGVFALTGCGGDNNGGSSESSSAASETKTESASIDDLNGTAWKLDSIILGGKEMTVSDYMKEVRINNLMIIMSFSENTVGVSKQIAGNLSADKTAYTFKDGKGEIPKLNMRFTLEGDSLKLVNVENEAVCYVLKQK